MERRCEQCGNALPARSRRDRRFCSDRCRMSAYSARQRAAVATVVTLPPSEELREHELVRAVARAADANWRAAAWLLERKWPDRWSATRKPTRELPADDPFAFLDEIAEARRRRLQRETSS
jgi:predicted nucleic acid-binding Zn ribbon protein